ncbi:MAG TPA: GNAT family N-acetyltransferase [Candidatus Binatia bacterium]
MQSLTARAREMDPALKLQARGAPAGAMIAGASEEVEIRRHEGCDALLALRPTLAAGGFLPAPLAGMDPEFLTAGFEGKTPGAMVAYAAGRPVGYMTYALLRTEFRPQFGGLGIGRFPCRQLRLFGYAGHGHAPAVILEGFCRGLLENTPWHVGQIFELPMENPLAEYITGAPFGSGESYSLASSVYETFQVGIAESFETYLKNQFTKKTRYNLKREVRLLEDSAPGEVTLRVYHAPDQVSDFFRDSASVASRCYKWQGGPNPMEPTPFDLKKFSFLAERGRWRSYVLFIRDVPVAFCDATMRWGELYVELVGHDARYIKLNPGKVLLYKIFEDLHECRIVKQLNLGTGTAEYRRVFATSSRRVVDVNLYRNELYPQLLRMIAATAAVSYRQLNPLIRRCAPPIKRILRRRGAIAPSVFAYLVAG